MLFRMNIRRSKSLIWVLNIAAILGITLLFVNIYKNKKDGGYDPASYEVFKKVLMEGVEGNSNDTYQTKPDTQKFSSLWNAPIFWDRSVKPKDNTGTVKPDVIDTEPLDSLVEVGSIFIDPLPERSRVRLHYPKLPAEDEKPFKVYMWNKEGDPLRYPYNDKPYNGKILKISEDEVLFSFRNEEVALKPKDGRIGEINSSARNVDGSLFDPTKQAKKRKSPDETTEVTPGNWHMSKKEYTYLRTETGAKKEMDMVNVAAVRDPKTGKTSLQVTSINESSLAYRRGIRSGDVLISINGFPVHTRSGAINYFEEHPKEGTYIVEISRSGKRMSKTFVAPED